MRWSRGYVAAVFALGVLAIGAPSTAGACGPARPIDIGDGARIHQAVDAEGILIFRVGRPGGVDLWRSDGTPSGTSVLRSELGFLSFPPDIENVDGTVYLSGLSETNQVFGIWKTDGTVEGTTLVKEFGLSLQPMAGFTAFDGCLYFRALGPSSDSALWKSDGTDTGTVVVKDLTPLQGSFPRLGVELGGQLLFAALDPWTSSWNIWKTDGTDEGTTQVSEVPGLGLTRLRDRVLFQAEKALWTTDGTSQGTHLVKSFHPSGLGPLVAAGGRVFFSTVVGDATELWVSDGTVPGTSRVAGGLDDISFLTAQGDAVFFLNGNIALGGSLWKSDGTEQGTALVKNLLATDLVSVNGTVFFVAKDDRHGLELWRTDGTEEGTVLVQDIHPGPGWSSPRVLVGSGRFLFFEADDGTGHALWAGRASILGDRPELALEELSSDLIAIGLGKGLENSLRVKLDHARRALAATGGRGAAINHLRAFIQHANAHRGKKIDSGDADVIVDFAREIIRLLEPHTDARSSHDVSRSRGR